MHTLDRLLASAGVDPFPQVPQRYVVPRGAGLEAAEVARRLGKFNASLSIPGHFVSQLHPGATKNELVALAQMIEFQAGRRFAEPQFIGRLDRVTRRSLDLVIKWYDDNWGIVQHFINDVRLADEKFRLLSGEGKVRKAGFG
jgi:hypothetical protein